MYHPLRKTNSVSSWSIHSVHSAKSLPIMRRPSVEYMRPMSAPTPRLKALLQRQPVIQAPPGSIAVSDEDGRTYAFRIINGTLPLLPLQLTFGGVKALYFINTGDEDRTRYYLHLKDSRFLSPEGGWRQVGRSFYVKKSKKTHFSRTDVLFRRFLALTHGVKIYADLSKNRRGSVVAAIDFGSAYTGYAFSFRSSPRQIYSNTWIAEGVHFQTDKAPTTVLMFPNGEFHSFGFDAEDEFARLSESDSQSGWYYFRNFKMKLWATRDLRRNSKLRDIEGKPMEAVKIFSKTTKFLKERLEQNVRKKRPSTDDDEIEWVLTVPAMGSDAAKQFMRECAIKAGIRPEMLRLVLEPEAASLYCKDKEMGRLRCLPGKERITIEPGDKYLLVDLGGGTCDISAHSVLSDGNLREIHSATGSALGGLSVDESFNKFMSELVDQDVMLLLQSDFACEYKELQREFETKKRIGIKPYENIVLRLPNDLLCLMKDQTDTTLEEAVQSSLYADRLKVKGDMLMMDGYMMEELFSDTVQAIINYIAQIKQHEALEGVRNILVTGGFSESRYVRKAIEAAFPDDNLIVPVQAGLAVLKGAVLMGHLPGIIVERISLQTYGVNYASPFQRGVHPESLREVRNGKPYCDDLFEKLVEVGQPVKVGQVFTVRRTTWLLDRRSKRKNLHTKLYVSHLKDPQYCTKEDGCVKIGDIVRRPPPNGWPDLLESLIEIRFGEAELTVCVQETTTGSIYEARIECLDH